MNIMVSSGITFIYIGGGPGLGSQYLCNLFASFYPEDKHIPYELPILRDIDNQSWLINFNLFMQKYKDPIIVGHSFGGMFLMSNIKIQIKAKAIILLSTSPSKKWENHSSSVYKKLGTEEMNSLLKKFNINPSNETFKELMLSWKPFYFSTSHFYDGEKLLENINYEYIHYQQANKVFYPQYSLAWKSVDVPILVLSGSLDQITPIKLFKEDELFSTSKKITFVELKGASHFPWIEKKEKFINSIQNFIQTIK